MNYRYHIPVLLAFLLYFTSFLTGRPGVELEPYADSGTFYTEERSDEDFIQNSNPEKTKQTLWKTGLIKRVLSQRKARNLFEDPLLVSDARPENFFKNIERTLIVDSFFLSLDLIWICMFILAILALLKKHWFYPSFIRILIYPSILFLLVVLLTSRRENMILSNAGAIVFIEILGETLLLFLGLALVFKSSLSGTDTEWIPFMDHLSKKFSVNRSSSGTGVQSVIQIVILVAVGLLLSNLLLLPIYKLQVTFPGMFAILILFALAALAFFYTAAYMKVSSSQNNHVSILSGVSFLGYRILKNTLFIIKILLIVSVVIGTVIFLADGNIKFLESIHFLDKKTGFD